MTNYNIKSFNYTQFQQFVYELLEKKEIEIVKDWNSGRVLYKDSTMIEIDGLNFVQIRSRWTKKYNILVSKQDFQNVLEGVAEEITTKPDNLDEWSTEVYEYLEINKITKIKLKDLASKVFCLSSKELNMKTQHRLGSILRTLGYIRNTKTSEWKKEVKTSPTDTNNDLEALQDISSKGMTNVGLVVLSDTTYLQQLQEATDLVVKYNAELQLANKTIADLESQLEEFKNKEATPITEIASRFTPVDRFSYSAS